jgi:hypothetical protein
VGRRRWMKVLQSSDKRAEWDVSDSASLSASLRAQKTSPNSPCTTAPNLLLSKQHASNTLISLKSGSSPPPPPGGLACNTLAFTLAMTTFQLLAERK